MLPGEYYSEDVFVYAQDGSRNMVGNGLCDLTLHHLFSIKKPPIKTTMSYTIQRETSNMHQDAQIKKLYVNHKLKTTWKVI